MFIPGKIYVYKDISVKNTHCGTLKNDILKRTSYKN